MVNSFKLISSDNPDVTPCNKSKFCNLSKLDKSFMLILAIDFNIFSRFCINGGRVLTVVNFANRRFNLLIESVIVVFGIIIFGTSSLSDEYSTSSSLSL